MFLDGSPFTPQDNNTAFHFFKKAADKVRARSGLDAIARR
jgi:hypothetical protein